tara:strand:- start:62 stop:958 length:897 start_codon:yes stop_codon:yes gene_type:complete
MNVLSLFDGMSCGQIALDKLGIKVDNYFASEIDKSAIQTTQKNYPNTIQVGGVVELKGVDLPKIDLLIGGSPCQGFSIAGRKLNFQDPKSKLFFEFVRLLKETKPKYFLLENVRMPEEIANAIDDILGVKRIFINSVEFTGLIRKRYYWTNIPVDKVKSKLKYSPSPSIKTIGGVIDNSVPYDKPMSFFLDRTPYKPSESSDGIITINPKKNDGSQTWQRGRVYDVKGRCPTICASLFDLNITEDHRNYRKLTINECEKLQGVPKDYTLGVPKGDRGKMLGNGWTVDVIKHIFKNLKQ